MANTIGTSESEISSAIENINNKKKDLEEQADRVSTAFTTLTSTVQLKWLNRLITESWNGDGSAIVGNAKTTLENLMTDLNTIQETAQDISEG